MIIIRKHMPTCTSGSLVINKFVFSKLLLFYLTFHPSFFSLMYVPFKSTCIHFKYLINLCIYMCSFFFFFLIELGNKLSFSEVIKKRLCLAYLMSITLAHLQNSFFNFWINYYRPKKKKNQLFLTYTLLVLVYNISRSL